VLDGVGLEPRHARVLREALQAELTRLVTATPKTWQESRRERRIAAPALRATAEPAVLGQNLAHSVYRGISAPRGRP
ncbi:MAG: hypothetical protein ACRDTH_26445, partial [Pseudonocardiaceae bacterium]